jgi:ElaB/YqjD/DUF883 family membrane-anchored ribosome-binding protein
VGARSYDVKERNAPQGRENRDPETIMQDIRRTRADMEGTIDEIQERLDPQRLRQEAQGAIHDATVGRAKRMAENVSDRAREASGGLMDTIRENPIPAAMVAVGLGWLWSQRSRSRRIGPHERAPYTLYEREEVPSPHGRRVRAVQQSRVRSEDRSGGRMGEAQQRAGEMAGEARQRAQQAQRRAGEMAGEARHRAEELVEQGQEQVQHVAEQAQYRVEQTRNRLGEMMEDNPLALGAVALAAGIAIGMAIPETRREHQMMGGMRDNLMDRAQHTAEKTMEKMQHVAEEAGRAAEEQARKENLAQ